MITSVHNLIYSDDPTATRAFVKDVLQFPFASEGPDDEPSSWLIFGTGRSELGIHPTMGADASGPRLHQITLMCDDLTATMADLAGRGAEFAGEPTDGGFGILVMVKVPGADDLMLYQPKHPLAYEL